jgi:hypothetical protein
VLVGFSVGAPTIQFKKTGVNSSAALREECHEIFSGYQGLREFASAIKNLALRPSAIKRA